MTKTASGPGCRLGTSVLVAAAVYEVTPPKYACLSQCRSPLGFLRSNWREGRGALAAFLLLEKLIPTAAS